MRLSFCGINDHSFGLMMGELSKHAEACPAGALHGVTELNICGDIISHKGTALISSALQTNTTMTKLNISGCNMSDDGAESLARALTVNKTLQVLDVRYNNISDTGIAHIATALKTNNTLKILFISGKTATEEGPLSLAAALTANSSMEYLDLFWSSTHPDSTLKHIGECVSKSTLRTLYLEINMPASGETSVTEERAKVWLQCLEVGGKELIQSLVDSHLQRLHLILDHDIRLYFKKHQVDQSHETLKAIAATVNTMRRQKGLPEIHTKF